MSDPSPRHPRLGLRTWIGAIGAPLTFVTVLALDLPVSPSASRLAAIFAAVLVAWLTEALPIAVTALLIAPLLVVFDVASPREAFRHYADPLLYLFVGGFFIAAAMSRHGLDRRMAYAVVRLRIVRGIPSRVRIALMVGGALMSMWISNTASTAILLPILLGLMGGRPREDRAVTGAILGVAYACSIGGLGTLVGSPPNLIAVRLLGEVGVEIGFLEWMAVGMPTAILVGIAVYIVTTRLFPQGALRGVTVIHEAEPEGEKGPWSRGEKVTAIAFCVAVVGWVLPGVVGAQGVPGADAIASRLHPGVVALLAASILFVLPDEEGVRVLPWARATEIDWGIILLFGGGIALGTQLVETGLAAAMSRGFVGLTGIDGLWSLTFVCAVFTIFFTEVCSNTASANILVPLAAAIALELGVAPAPPALAVGLAASCAFMLPIATGPNAIAFSSGRVPQLTMLRTGLLLNVISALLVFAILRVLCPLLGWA